VVLLNRALIAINIYVGIFYRVCGVYIHDAGRKFGFAVAR
jgi:hypothetical protein